MGSPPTVGGLQVSMQAQAGRRMPLMPKPSRRPEVPMRGSVAALVAVLAALPLAAHAAPLAGRWDGVFHGGRGDQAVTLICRAGAGGALTGLLYMGGDLMGPLENGMVDG